jgi:signal transduction histidine kinase
MSDSKSSTSDPIAAACLGLIARLCESGQLQANQELTANDLDLTELRRQLEAAKLESIAEFAAGAGHEINNPAATIAGRAALLLKSETDPERRRSLETIGGQAYRIRDMIGDAMTFARPPQPLPQRFDPLQEVQNVLAAWSDRLTAKGIQPECHFESGLRIYADREQFRVVVATLLRNVFEIPQSPLQLRLSVLRENVSPTMNVVLSVEDNGPGLTPLERTHLFDPFYSGRAAGRGLGFGLTKCWRIARLNGGSIEASVSELGGLALHTSWPIESQDTTAR